jgi:hypothetical protein
MDCDPNDLAQLAKCFDCLPPIVLQQIQAYLLCQIVIGGGITPGGSGNLVFAGVSGFTPPFPPTTAGTTAFNENTNEMWFVNSSLAWQQIIAV